MQSSKLNQPDAYEAALRKTLADREQHGDCLREARKHVLMLEERDRALVTLARTLLKEMPADRQIEYLERFPWLSLGPDPASRQAVLLGIVQMFMSDPALELTPPEVEQRLEAKGIHANAKRIYNSLNYLAADGRLRRAARGRYSAGSKLSMSAPAEVA